MRTNIEIDDKLLKDAMKVAGVKTKKAAVEWALRRMLQIQGQAGIRKLRGKVDFFDEVIKERDVHQVNQPARTKKAA